MMGRIIGLVVAMIGIVGFSATLTHAGDPKPDPAKAKADTRFDELLAKAKADPSRTNWKALRHAYAASSHYHPYDTGWRDQLVKIRTDARNGDLKGAEAEVVKLRDRDGWSRIDVLIQAEQIFNQIGQKEQAQLHHKFVEGYLMSIIVPGEGKSFEKSFEVIYVDEEYLTLHLLGQERDKQALIEQKGHFFDVLTTKAKGAEPAEKFYFNVDLPHSWLKTMFKSPKADSKPNPKPKAEAKADPKA